MVVDNRSRRYPQMVRALVLGPYTEELSLVLIFLNMRAALRNRSMKALNVSSFFLSNDEEG